LIKIKKCRSKNQRGLRWCSYSKQSPAPFRIYEDGRRAQRRIERAQLRKRPPIEAADGQRSSGIGLLLSPMALSWCGRFTVLACTLVRPVVPTTGLSAPPRPIDPMPMLPAIAGVARSTAVRRTARNLRDMKFLRDIGRVANHRTTNPARQKASELGQHHAPKGGQLEFKRDHPFVLTSKRASAPSSFAFVLDLFV